MSGFWQNKHLSKEHKKNISESHIGIHYSKETKRKMSKSHLGKHFSEKTKRKMSIAHKGKPNGMLGKHHSEKTKRIMRKLKVGKILSKEHKRKLKENHKGMLGKHFSEESKRKMSIAAKRKWQNPRYAEKQLKVIMKSLNFRPTKPEKQLNRLLQKILPGEYRYVGDGRVWIGGGNPDFININGQKKIIELFGNYWHSKRITGLKKKEHRKQRQKLFAKYGYQTLVVWERELKSMNKLKRKLRNFMEIKK